jgi:uncharacterized membrane protein YhaH (DUF805 family)
MVQENRSIFSYSGLLGRQYFLILHLVYMGLTAACFIPLVVVAVFLNLAGFGEKESTNILTIMIFPFILAVYAFAFGLTMRRLRDLFNLTNREPARDFAIAFAYVLTAGFCFLGTIALWVWPGTLYKQSKMPPTPQHPAPPVTTNPV